MKFIDKIINRLESINSHVCIGLDSRYDRIPYIFKKNQTVLNAIFAFNKNVIEATHHLATAYKSNLAFYAGFEHDGFEAAKLTNEYIKSYYPEIPIIADCKRSEMGESAKMTKQEIFDWLQFDCIMVTPWFGEDTVSQYLQDKKQGVCVYIHNSNPSAGEFQDLALKNGKYLYEVVAERVSKVWNSNGNIFVEAGATYPEQLKKIRKIIGEDMPLLTAGIGAQGAPVENVKGLFGKNKKRLLVNSSRNIIFAGENRKDYFLAVKEAAENLCNDLLRVTKL